MGIIRKRIVVLLAVLSLMTASFASCGSIAGVEEDGETLSVIFQGEIDGDSVVFGPGEEKTIACNFYRDNANYEITVTY